MKKFLILLAIIGSALFSNAQDIDFYLKNKNDNFNFPKIPENMTFKEYYLLSQTFRMQDMLFATIVPGYIHFKAQDNRTAYVLVGLRSCAISILTYEYFKLKKETNNTSFSQFLFSTDSTPVLTKADRNLASAAAITFAATYFFDIIHGKYVLEKKQEQIRFKYSPRISFYTSGLNKRLSMGLGLAMQVKF